jgi:hypothetical protein
MLKHNDLPNFKQTVIPHLDAANNEAVQGGGGCDLPARSPDRKFRLMTGRVVAVHWSRARILEFRDTSGN